MFPSRFPLIDSFLDFKVEEESLWPKDSPVFQGGDLSPQWLLSAYFQGLYPLYFGSGEEVYWWSPDPRMVLFLKDFHLSSRFKRTLRQRGFTFSYNQNTSRVIELCSQATRPSQKEGETWIYPEVIKAYSHLAQEGIVHSVEVWQADQLVGGLYGLSLGKIFFGESMFSSVSGASRAGMAYLVEVLTAQGFWLIDCQQESAYLASMGAKACGKKRILFLVKEKLYLHLEEF